MLKPPFPLKCLFVIDIYKDLYFESLYIFSRHENNTRCLDLFYHAPLLNNYYNFVGIHQFETFWSWRM